MTFQRARSTYESLPPTCSAAGPDGSLVPPTVVRDGPHGVGSVQLYVQPDAERQDQHDFWSSRDPAIERMVLFDHIVNNADRKISHCLRDATGKVWGIDHGLTFNREPKLRTVLWQFVGEPISPPLRRELAVLRDRGDELHDTLGDVLDRREIDALLGRISRFANHGCYPSAQSAAERSLRLVVAEAGSMAGLASTFGSSRRPRSYPRSFGGRSATPGLKRASRS